MDELRSDPGWVEELMGAYFKHRGGLLGAGEAASRRTLEHSEGVSPISTLQIWRTVGFDGIANGRHQITNPLEWALAVESWLEGLELPSPEQQRWCITRTSLGSMQLQGETSGPVLNIVSILGFLYPDSDSYRSMLDPVIRKHSGCVGLLTPLKDAVRNDVPGRRLVDEGFRKPRSLGPDEVFALVPTYRLTGRLGASSPAKEPAVTHVAPLGQNTEPEIRLDLIASLSDVLVEQIVTQDNQPPNSSGQ